jgi:methyl-accepting chemotaxis protein
MNVKKIVIYIIIGVVCFIIGAIASGVRVYFYTEKRVSIFNQHVKIANEHLRSIETGFYEAKRFVKEAITINQQLTDSINASRDRIKRLEDIDKRLIERLEKYGNPE